MRRSALVVGATRGIGLALVKNLREDGWAVTATYRKPEDAAKLQALGASTVQLDVTDADGANALAASLAKHSLDLAIINAGVLPKGDDDIAARMRQPFWTACASMCWHLCDSPDYCAVG